MPMTMSKIFRCGLQWCKVLQVPGQRILKCASPVPQRSMVTASTHGALLHLRHPTSLPFTWSRNLWGYVNAVANRPDKSRIKEVGPQRACAEWLLRCGAHVRWEGIETFQTDYNKLPSGNFQKFKIAEINADNAALMEIGFPHFEGVETVRKIRFHFCTYLEDKAIHGLDRLKDCLEDLEISSCGDVTDAGLASLVQLINLKELLLCDLPAVRNKTEVLKTLKTGLPDCHIVYKDLERSGG